MPKTRTNKRYHKHRKANRGFFGKLRRTTNKALPVVASGLKRVGSNVKNITIKSKPVLEKGLGTIYKTVMSGFDLGVKGINKGVRIIKKRTASKTRRHK